jgi:hypothetical protein
MEWAIVGTMFAGWALAMVWVVSIVRQSGNRARVEVDDHRATHRAARRA